MAATSEFKVGSADGTVIAAESYGDGPVVVLVDGALSHRRLGPMRAIGAALASEFTVCAYDRRGRGASADSPPYAVEREVEDLAAVLAFADAPAAVFGLSSGAALALEAAASGLGIDRLVVHEPPFSVEAHPAHLERAAELRGVLADDGPGAAVDWFLSQIGVPPQALEQMHGWDEWPAMEAVGHTLPYDYAILGDSAVPAERLGRNAVPAVEFFRAAARVAADAIPSAEHRELAGVSWGQASPAAIAAAISAFLRAG